MVPLQYPPAKPKEGFLASNFTNLEIKSIFAFSEPFCSPIVPHIPIRQRLSSRRGTSADVGEEVPMGIPYASSIYGGQRRRRMSLLQTLRQQNRQLNDSGLDIHRLRTDSESTNRGKRQLRGPYTEKNKNKKYYEEKTLPCLSYCQCSSGGQGETDLGAQEEQFLETGMLLISD
ncbi:unnamed protein product [Haemonchus placei]|uniref:Uncharacterized protein n=1 Tax=Haemonchus placei TaxID=6290 RepID=A0A0N4X4D7_HAEPC|nr:unnamed protein product [Haemonchus placei]